MKAGNTMLLILLTFLDSLSMAGLLRSRSPAVLRKRSEQGNKAGHFNEQEGGRDQSLPVSTPTHHKGNDDPWAVVMDAIA